MKWIENNVKSFDNNRANPERILIGVNGGSITKESNVAAEYQISGENIVIY